MMDQKTPIVVEEESIDITEWLRSLYRYKIMILLVVILFGLGSAYYAYFLPNIYKSTASVKVGLDEEEYAKDVISMAMGKGALNAATEKDLITSRYLADKALKIVDFREHYYSKINFKEIELYKDSPLKAILTKGYGISFVVTILDNNSYKLSVDSAIRENGTIWNYDEVHHFGDDVNTTDFHVRLIKIGKIQEDEYRFVIDKECKSYGSVFVTQNSENSTILQISVEDTVPLRAQEYANALAEAYVNQNVENKSREATQRLVFINTQLDKIRLRIKDADTKLEEFRKKSKLVNVDTKTENLSTRLDENEAVLVNLKIKEEMLKTFYEQVKLNKKLETLSIEGIEKEDSSLSTMMKELHEAVLEKKLLKQDYTNLHPLVLKMSQKISQLRSIIMNTVNNLIGNINKRKKLLLENIEKERTILNTLPENARRYGQLERQFKMNEEIYTFMMKRKTEAEMIKASTVSKNRLLDRAAVPFSPVKPKRKAIIMIGLFIGLVVGLLLAILRIMLDTKIKNENDINQIVSYPVLGVIPKFDTSNIGWKANIKVMESVKSAVAESFRHLRSNLQFLVKQTDSQVLLITSTVGQEGKTTIAVNLGAIMSLAKKRTIILNLDMRKPTLHERFDLPNQSGLSELLNDRVSLRDVIQETRYPQLDILSSGIIPPNPSELIQSKRMYEVLEALKQKYDYIILDTPPIGLVTDAKELMFYADINIYIVRSDYSKKEFLEDLQQYDFIKNISHLGIVLNDFNMKKSNYGYYADYGYYEDKKH